MDNPDKIWVIVCKNIDTGEVHVFREPTGSLAERERFTEYARKVECWIGHNLIDFDYPVICSLTDYRPSWSDPFDHLCDTLILSKLADYSRADGHSIEAYGHSFGLEKIDFTDFTEYSQELEDYCKRDVEICERIFRKHERMVLDHSWKSAVDLEQRFQDVVTGLRTNGFAFNISRARTLLARVSSELAVLDLDIKGAYPDREVVIREFTPKLTKFGTISKTSVPRSLWDRIHEYEAGNTYPVTRIVPFNPSSHKQIVDILHDAGWRPVDKTSSHIEAEREVNRLKYHPHNQDDTERIEKLKERLKHLGIYGFKVNEANITTLPDSAPAPARLLAKRILLESRRRTLTEWLELVQPDGRIHGKFIGIGAWTQRMAHQSPNTANIPNEFDISGKKKLLGKEMRALWQAPKGRLLVGVDAEGIQLRIFAHYINDPEFTKALVEGKKDDKTDPHSLNQRILGNLCKSRAAAKRFIYALLLGAGLWKLSQILECSETECREALERLLQRYSGWKSLREEVIPKDANRGWFTGLDGRKVQIPGTTVGERKHLAMSGYLQNGEAIVMKRATLKWHHLLKEESAILVNFVHDEWQTECPNDVDCALRIARLQSASLETVGRELGLRCPLAGSYWNEEAKDYTIATNWSKTH